ncbi:MAG: DUF4326 domain-containing protein [Aestuariibacter sp.]|nr:DUF4326 domain-containing protein [Aestuariibacter sp.]
MNKTTRVNVLTEQCDIPVHRPSKWGNPFRIKNGLTRQQVLKLYRDHILSQPHLVKQLHRLQGKRLGCFCKKHQACHVDVLIELIELIVERGRKLKRGGLFSRES